MPEIKDGDSFLCIRLLLLWKCRDPRGRSRVELAFYQHFMRYKFANSEQTLKGQGMRAKIPMTGSWICWAAGGESAKVLEWVWGETHFFTAGQGLSRDGRRGAEASSFESTALPMVDVLYRSSRAFQKVCVLFTIHQNGTQMHFNRNVRTYQHVSGCPVSLSFYFKNVPYDMRF